MKWIAGGQRWFGAFPSPREAHGSVDLSLHRHDFRAQALDLVGEAFVLGAFVRKKAASGARLCADTRRRQFLDVGHTVAAEPEVDHFTEPRSASARMQ